MKETLKQKLEYRIEKLHERCRQLKRHIEEYRESGDYQSAYTSQVKYEQLNMVAEDLEKILLSE